MTNKLQSLGHGTYTEITEREFLDSVIKSPRAVVHFYHEEFSRCKIVDARLSAIALKIMGCRFVKIDATKCPFFVAKLNIKVLPSIIYFINGKTVHRITGFAEFGGSDGFEIPELVKSLEREKMLTGSDESKWRPLITAAGSTATHSRRREAISDGEDDSEEW